MATLLIIILLLNGVRGLGARADCNISSQYYCSFSDECGYSFPVVGTEEIQRMPTSTSSLYWPFYVRLKIPGRRDCGALLMGYQHLIVPTSCLRDNRGQLVQLEELAAKIGWNNEAIGVKGSCSMGASDQFSQLSLEEPAVFAEKAWPGCVGFPGFEADWASCHVVRSFRLRLYKIPLASLSEGAHGDQREPVFCMAKDASSRQWFMRAFASCAPDEISACSINVNTIEHQTESLANLIEKCNR